MGKSETSSISLGYKIKISDLINQLDSNNIEIINTFLVKGFIEDENDGFNDMYININFSLNFYEDIKINDEVEKYKQTLISEFKNNGNLIKLRSGGYMEDKSIPLYNMDLLIPIQSILETTRWGYDRYGTNGLSIPLDDIIEKVNSFKLQYNIKNLKTVFILKQESG